MIKMDKLIEFIQYVGKLKKIKRTGWVDVGIKNSESVAGHSFGVAVLAMILAKKFNLDENKIIKMALVHDIAESIIGDISVEDLKDEKAKEEKLKKENEAMKNIFSNLENGNEFYQLWLEYEEQETPEAKILREIDRIELLSQALEYEQENESEKLDCFWKYASNHPFENPELRKLYEEFKKRRKK